MPNLASALGPQPIPLQQNFSVARSVVLLNLPHLAAFCHSQRLQTNMLHCFKAVPKLLFQTNKKGSTTEVLQRIETRLRQRWGLPERHRVSWWRKKPSCWADYLDIMALFRPLARDGMRQRRERSAKLLTHRLKSPPSKQLICWNWTSLLRCTQFFAAKFQFLIPQEPTPSHSGNWN